MDPNHPDIDMLEQMRRFKLNRTPDTYNSESRWTAEEKQKFDEAVEKYGKNEFSKIAEYIGNEKTAWQVRNRYMWVRNANKHNAGCETLEKTDMAEKNERWHSDEVEKFQKAIKEYGRDIQKITEALGTRTFMQVRNRFQLLKQRLKLDPSHPDSNLLEHMLTVKAYSNQQDTTMSESKWHWSQTEKEKLFEAVEKFGRDWAKISEFMGNERSISSLKS